MTKVFATITTSIDGYYAGPNDFDTGLERAKAAAGDKDISIATHITYRVGRPG